jgi:hypothetical protein
MITDYENLLVKILDTVTHGDIFPRHFLEQRTGFKKAAIEQTIHDIETGAGTFTADSKITGLREMVILTEQSDGHETEIQAKTGKSRHIKPIVLPRKRGQALPRQTPQFPLKTWKHE